MAQGQTNPYRVLLHYSWPHATAYTILLLVIMLGGDGFFLAWTVAAVLFVLGAGSWFAVASLALLYRRSLSLSRPSTPLPHDESPYSTWKTGSIPIPIIQPEYPRGETL